MAAWRQSNAFSTKLPPCEKFLFSAHRGMAICWPYDVPLKSLSTSQACSVAEMIILLTIKRELCSWRNFHPDAYGSLWIVITIKSSCSYLFLFAYVQEPQLFSQTKPFSKNAAQDSQSISENSPFGASCWEDCIKYADFLIYLWTVPHLLSAINLPSLVPASYSPLFLSWGRPRESALCWALERQRTNITLFAQMELKCWDQEFIQETELFPEIEM